MLSYLQAFSRHLYIAKTIEQIKHPLHNNQAWATEKHI